MDQLNNKIQENWYTTNTDETTVLPLYEVFSIQLGVDKCFVVVIKNHLLTAGGGC